MRVAVVGGGINGLCCAWRLSQAGHAVSLFERNRVMKQTSCASSKLLHGGLRYLETGQFRLVREALRERDRWLRTAPRLTRPLPMILPCYDGGRRPRWRLKAGLALYGLLAGRSGLRPSRWLSAREIAGSAPSLRTLGLKGGYLFFDGQMDDYALGLWVASRCRDAGVSIGEGCEVRRVSPAGELLLADGRDLVFDRIVNVAGPWARQLLESSEIESRYTLDLVRGSHLVVDKRCSHAFLLEVPGETRIFFVLPWKGRTLIGTTEVRQTLGEPVICRDEEKAYLIDAYNHYFESGLQDADICETFAGIRPLLYSAKRPTCASRDYALQRDHKLVSVFGGKWTTALALAEKAFRLAR